MINVANVATTASAIEIFFVDMRLSSSRSALVLNPMLRRSARVENVEGRRRVSHQCELPVQRSTDSGSPDGRRNAPEDPQELIAAQVLEHGGRLDVAVVAVVPLAATGQIDGDVQIVDRARELR